MGREAGATVGNRRGVSGRTGVFEGGRTAQAGQRHAKVSYQGRRLAQRWAAGKASQAVERGQDGASRARWHRKVGCNGRRLEQGATGSGDDEQQTWRLKPYRAAEGVQHSKQGDTERLAVGVGGAGGQLQWRRRAADLASYATQGCWKCRQAGEAGKCEQRG